METSISEYNFCKSIIENYDSYKDILKNTKGCNHDRSKERELYERTTKDKLNAIRLFCEEGNKLYKSGRYEDAISEYKNSLIYIDYTFPDNDIEEKEYNNLIIRVHLNLSACFLKIEEYNMTILHCKNVLKYDPKNLKGQYRLAEAYIGIYKYDESLSIINDILHDENDYKDCEKSVFNKLRNDILNIEKKYKESNNMIYKKLFSK